MGIKADKVINVPRSLKEGGFFNRWVLFLKPLHKLTDTEMKVLACFIKTRYELSKAISDDTILEEVLMNDATKRKIREECGLKPSHFQVILGKFKKEKLIENNKIHSKLIPPVKEEQDHLDLLIRFELDK